MLTDCRLSDRLLSRWLRRPWPPGFFIPGCYCCAAGAGTSHHVFGGNQAGAIPIRDTDQYSIDTWTSKTDCPTPARSNLAASTVGTAAYIYCGSSTASPFSLRDTDEYVPDTWTSKTDCPTPGRQDMAAATISSRGYIFCGEDVTPTLLQDTDEYDPDTWTSRTSAPAPARELLGASAIGTKGYVYCGYDGVSNLQDTDEYTPPATDTWASKTSSPTPARSGVSGLTLDDGGGAEGYIFGGSSVGLGTDTDKYDAGGDSWAASTDIPSPARQWYGASSPNGSTGYVTCGQSGAGSRMSDNDEFTPSIPSWTSRTDCPAPARQLLAGSAV